MIGKAITRVLADSLKLIEIDLDVKYYELDSLFDKMRTRSEPFDLVVEFWADDYADSSSPFLALLNPALPDRGNINVSRFVDPRISARIEATNRLLPGRARRNAWSQLEVDLLRTDPPWAPIAHGT